MSAENNDCHEVTFGPTYSLLAELKAHIKSETAHDVKARSLVNYLMWERVGTAVIERSLHTCEPSGATCEVFCRRMS